METEKRQKGEQQQASSISKLYVENTLLRVAGALFCHDPKRASARTGEIEVNASIAEKRIVIRPDPQLGAARPTRPQDLRRVAQEALRLRPTSAGRGVVQQPRTHATHRSEGMGVAATALPGSKKRAF
jgi:hypothetical protein